MTKQETEWKGQFDDYHRWYYDSYVWMQVRYLGVPCEKSVSDMWNYQEILCERRPSLVVEFGTHNGGSALFFSNILQLVSAKSRVLAVDHDLSHVHERVRSDQNIELLGASTVDPIVFRRIAELREEFPGAVFAILDSAHHKDHVLAELRALRGVLICGDYVIVEDGNINGHPVLPGWGEGPLEAIIEYERQFPADFEHDVARESKFGFTFAPRGFLVKL